MDDKRLVLRFLAGKEPGVEFPLEDFGREIVIGRAEELDLVLDDARVSRKHARILVDRGRYLIEDLGSTNGIFVNAHRVRRSLLKEGDRIQIGTSLLKMITSTGRQAGRLDHTMLLFPPGETDAGAADAKDASRFSGSIEEIPLLDLVQLLSTSRKSGILEVEGPQGQGKLYLRGGQIVYAVLRRAPPTMPPRKVIYRMLAWTSGTFELKPGEGFAFEGELTEQTEGLVLEAMRQFDEIARMGRRLPPRELRLVVARPTPPIKALASDQIEVLKIVYTYPKSTIGAILDLSPVPDLETYHALVHLARGGYVLRGDGVPQPPPPAGGRQP